MRGCGQDIAAFLPQIARDYLDSFAATAALGTCSAARSDPLLTDQLASARRLVDSVERYLATAVPAGELQLPGCCPDQGMLMRAGLLLLNPSRPVIASKNYQRMYSDYLLCNAKVPDEATYDAWRQANGVRRGCSCADVVRLLNPGLDDLPQHQDLLRLLANAARCEFALPTQYFMATSAWSPRGAKAVRCTPPVLRLHWSYGGFSGVLCARGHRRIEVAEGYYMPRMREHRLPFPPAAQEDSESESERS